MKTIVNNDDGWSSYMRYPAPMSPDDIIRATVRPVRLFFEDTERSSLPRIFPFR